MKPIVFLPINPGEPPPNPQFWGSLTWTGFHVPPELGALIGLQDKLQEYIENGVRLGLLIDDFWSVGDHRKSRRVHRYRPGRSPEILQNPEIVSCEPELPGFALKMAKIW